MSLSVENTRKLERIVNEHEKLTCLLRSKKSHSVRKAVRKQLGYVKRNLKHVEKFAIQSDLGCLNRKQYRDLLVIKELCRQQKHMYDTNMNRIDDRIVSIHQPHVRPIVRGKTHMSVGFGAKLSMSLVDG